MNIQVAALPDGTPLWFSRATPGRTHVLTAARAHGIVQICLTSQILVLADRTYQGAGATARTPTAAATYPSTTRRTTGTAAACTPLANAPPPDSSPGGCCGERAAQPSASGGSWQPCTPS
jgi:hypothetical protein